MSLTKVSYSMIEGTPINVLDYGVDNTGTTNNATALQSIIDNAPANACIYFPAGTYLGYIFVWRDDLTIQGAGMASTIIKLPNNCPSVTVPYEGGGTITGLPNVIEVGKCALGNNAPQYTNVTIKDLTIDGNYTNNTAPTTDLFGHGMIITHVSNCVFENITVQDCFLTGIDNVINSNFNFINAIVYDCGNATVYGGHYPNFDVNSSKGCHFNIISSGGYYGGRLLDNCWGNFIDITVYSPSITGFVYDNQTVNSSYSNTINVNVQEGCDSGQGISIGTNCFNSTINANVSNVVGTAVLVGGASLATSPSGNTITVNTYNNGGPAFLDNQYSVYNTYVINSVKDGRSGSAGTSFAVYIYGDYNVITATIKEGSTPQVRGFFFESSSSNNQLAGFTLDPNLYQAYNNLGSNNGINWGQGGASVASAETINLPNYGTTMFISGTTNIVSISPVSTMTGRQITLFFTASLTVSGSGGGNIKLAGGSNFSATSDDTLTLVSNGTNWYEVSRSVN